MLNLPAMLAKFALFIVGIFTVNSVFNKSPKGGSPDFDKEIYQEEYFKGADPGAIEKIFNEMMENNKELFKLLRNKQACEEKLKRDIEEDPERWVQRLNNNFKGKIKRLSDFHVAIGKEIQKKQSGYKNDKKYDKDNVNENDEKKDKEELVKFPVIVSAYDGNLYSARNYEILDEIVVIDITTLVRIIKHIVSLDEESIKEFSNDMKTRYKKIARYQIKWSSIENFLTRQANVIVSDKLKILYKFITGKHEGFGNELKGLVRSYAIRVAAGPACTLIYESARTEFNYYVSKSELERNRFISDPSSKDKKLLFSADPTLSYLLIYNEKRKKDKNEIASNYIIGMDNDGTISAIKVEKQNRASLKNDPKFHWRFKEKQLGGATLGYMLTTEAAKKGNDHYYLRTKRYNMILHSKGVLIDPMEANMNTIWTFEADLLTSSYSMTNKAMPNHIVYPTYKGELKTMYKTFMPNGGNWKIKAVSSFNDHISKNNELRKPDSI